MRNLSLRGRFPMPLIVLSALVGACTGNGGGGGGGGSFGNGWSSPVLLEDVVEVDDIGMDASGNALFLYGANYKVYDGAWTTGTHGLSGATIAVGAEVGVLVGNDVLNDIYGHIFRNGLIEPVETLVSSTNVSFSVATASESGAAAAWIEGDQNVVLRAWTAAGGWGAPSTLARSRPCDDLVVDAVDESTFVVAWSESLMSGGTATLASVLEVGSWSTAENLAVDRPLAVATLSDGRVLLVAASDSTNDNAAALIYESGAGWSEPEILDIGGSAAAVDTDDHGNAVVRSGSKIARYDGDSWTVMPIADENYSTGGMALEIQASGAGFAFALCSEEENFSLLYACLFPFDGSDFGSPAFLTEGSYYLGASTSEGTALNDAGQAIVTWTAPTEPEGDIYRTWASLRE